MTAQLILAVIGSMVVVTGVPFGIGIMFWLARRYLERQYKALLRQAAMNRDLKGGNNG